MNIKVFKLISAEEVVGEVTKNEDDYLMVRKPRVLAMVPAGNGQVGAQLMPYVISAPDDEIKLYKAGIVGEVQHTPIGLEKGYIENTSSIQLATP